MNEETIIKFLKGELNLEDKEEFYKWLNHDSSHYKTFTDVKQVWALSQLANHKQPWDTEKEVQLFKYRQQERGKYQKSIRLYQNLLKIAVVFIVVFGSLTFYFSRTSVSKNEISTVAFNEITTQAGEKSKITLADGSQIWLNACTKLKYPSDITSNQIDLYLEGEAYFDLKKVRNRKITVHTSEININVLGTAFNLRAYSDEDIIETALIRGQIAIERKYKSKKKNKNLLLLQPSQSASFVKSNVKANAEEFSELYIRQRQNADKTKEIALKENSNMIVAQSINSDLLIAWKEGRLSFKNESFGYLVKKLEKRYDVKIVVAGTKLKETRFTGAFEKETIEQALRALSYPVPFKYRMNKDTIIIEHN